MDTKPWRVLDIMIDYRDVGIWNMIWGADIFINGIPLLKCSVAIHILIWLLIK